MTIEKETLILIKLILSKDEADKLREILRDRTFSDEPVNLTLFRTKMYNDLSNVIIE